MSTNMKKEDVILLVGCGVGVCLAVSLRSEVKDSPSYWHCKSILGIKMNAERQLET